MGEYFEKGHTQPPTLEEIKKAFGDERFREFEGKLNSMPGVDVEAMHETTQKTVQQMEQMRDNLKSFRRNSLQSFIDEMREITTQLANLAMESAGWKDSKKGVVLNRPETRTIIAQSEFLHDRKSNVFSRFLASHDKFLDEESEERMLMDEGKNLQ